MKSRLSGLALMALLVLLPNFVAISRASAQSTTDGAIGGTVTDQSGAVVPGAMVSARNLGTAHESSGVTDGSGRYLLIHLQPGAYSLEVTVTGFAGFKATTITV